MDKFVVKMPAVSATKKASSHLPPYMTAHDRARKYPEGTFHVDDGLSRVVLLIVQYCYRPSPKVRGGRAPRVSNTQAESGAKPRKQTANSKNGSKLQNVCTN